MYAQIFVSNPNPNNDIMLISDMLLFTEVYSYAVPKDTKYNSTNTMHSVICHLVQKNIIAENLIPLHIMISYCVPS